jgi:hypothetical protein
MMTMRIPTMLNWCSFGFDLRWVEKAASASKASKVLLDLVGFAAVNAGLGALALDALARLL